MEFTLVSYNIHSGIGTDGRFDLGRIVAVLQETGADVIALQEVGDYRNRTPTERHPEELAEALKLHMAFGPNVVNNGRRYGNAVLSRLPILRSRNYDLSVPKREPRGALRCDLDLGGPQPLHIFCLHLGLAMRERRRQEALLLSADIFRDSVRQSPVVVCGDFNYWGNGPVPSWVRGAIDDAALLLRSASCTYPSRFPFIRLDRIFVDAGIRPLSVRTHRSPLSQKASDHLPLVMKCEARSDRQPQSGPVELIR